MPLSLEPARIEAVANRFRAFFLELADTFVERDNVLKQIALALLCKEHALMTGPPGTAKSQLATAVFGRILCERSGEPSVYARQITESTVQTDLIGPVDFKHLMDTGRTVHFTDEGMLGAVHAFLDEVFDGRDMLLRSALNVLQERELKQGTTITKGRIECALMTSNRYVADVIEQSRETLLAFVDRIAFVSFVPRGFADPAALSKVLDRHVANRSGPALDALLTIQDLDVLQALMEKVVVSPQICSSLAQLLSDLDNELNAAVRADPSFMPTRYLSTRTAVRSGKVLRAACVYDFVMSDRERELQVQHDDLWVLALHVILAGPSAQQLEALLARESDAEERRQLEIARTEREIFDRCLARLPRSEPPPLDRNVLSVESTTPSNRPSQPPNKEPSQTKQEAKASRQLEQLAGQLDAAGAKEAIAVMQQLSPLVTEAEPIGTAAQALFEQATTKLNSASFRASLIAPAEPDADLLESLRELASLAASVDTDRVSSRALAQGLRDSMVQRAQQLARFAVGSRQRELRALDAKTALGLGDERVALLEELASLRERGLDGLEPTEQGQADWEKALLASEEDLAAYWDAAFCLAVEQLLHDDPNTPLATLLSAVSRELGWLDIISSRMSTLRGGPSPLKSIAVERRLLELLAALMGRVEAVTRETLHKEIASVHALLEQAGLEGSVVAEQWLMWAAEALVRSEPQTAQNDTGRANLAGYRKLRLHEQRSALSLSLCEVALQLAPELSQENPVATMAGIAELVARLPAALRDQIATLDLARIERATGYLRRWWSELSDAGPKLDEVVRSQLFQVLWDEAALARFAVEAGLVADLLPEQRDRVMKMIEQLAALQSDTRLGARALLVERTDAAWRAALSGGNHG